VFENTSLADAAAEMNRYASVPITVAANVGGKRVSGVFAIDASESFAKTAAMLHGLRLERNAAGITLKAP
jgi:ferric-dicitrate binding protein FerR (iron transport regulator)